MSNLYTFQEKLEESLATILPDGVSVYSRRKGNVDSDVEAALANIGIAVLVFPPLPTQWSAGVFLRADKVETEIHIIENAILQSTQESAYSLLETIALHCHSLRLADLGSPVINLGKVVDNSPADEAITHFILTISNSLQIQ